MKTRDYFALAGLLWVLTFPGFCQGTFINLDFENPVLPLVPVDFQVPIADAMPGWSGYIGSSFPVDKVIYDTIPLSAAGISIHDTNRYIDILQGTYSVFLQVSLPGGVVVPAIGQTGTLPGDVRSIRFYAQGVPTVTFAGQPISLSLLGSTPTYGILGGDITPFANQTGELLFSGYAVIDNITFSSQAIPEPSVLCLSALGAFLIGFRSCRRIKD